MRQRRQPTEEQKQRAAERRERFRNLAKQIAAMSEAERAALADRMGAVVTIEGRPLSLGNTLLANLQRPDVTIVGGFNQWKSHGRAVVKGEHGLMIWAPVKGAAGEPSAGVPDPGELDRERPRFIMVTVFDVTQTQETEAA